MNEPLIARIEKYLNADHIPRNESSSGLLREALQALKAEEIITRIEGSHGRSGVVYLRDGTKIVVCRDKTTKGPAWLEVKPQAKIGFAASEPH